MVIGRMGAGKSTLCNNLVNQGISSCTNEENASCGPFLEGQDIHAGVTKEPRSQPFQINSEGYLVIDTVGFGDMELSTCDIVFKTTQTVLMAPRGFKAIIFLFESRISEEIVNIFNLFRQIFPGCDKNLLIVKNKENYFSNKKTYENNLKGLSNPDKFPGFKDAFDNGAGFLVINTNPDIPTHYHQSFELLAATISNISEVYQPQEYLDLVENLRTNVNIIPSTMTSYMQKMVAKHYDSLAIGTCTGLSNPALIAACVLATQKAKPSFVSLVNNIFNQDSQCQAEMPAIVVVGNHHTATALVYNFIQQNGNLCNSDNSICDLSKWFQWPEGIFINAQRNILLPVLLKDFEDTTEKLVEASTQVRAVIVATDSVLGVNEELELLMKQYYPGFDKNIMEVTVLRGQQMLQIMHNGASWTHDIRAGEGDYYRVASLLETCSPKTPFAPNAAGRANIDAHKAGSSAGLMMKSTFFMLVEFIKTCFHIGWVGFLWSWLFIYIYIFCSEILDILISILSLSSREAFGSVVGIVSLICFVCYIHSYNEVPSL
jgi:hypothetical protein